MKHIMDKVDLFSEKMLLHYASPNKDLVVEIFQFDADGLSDLPQQQLAKYVLVMGQYLVMLQHNENMKNVEYMLLSKTFEYELSKEKFSQEDVQGKTEKERRAWLLLNTERLRKLDEEVTVVEAEKSLISGMVKAIENLLNALKKEMSGRYTD